MRMTILTLVVLAWPVSSLLANSNANLFKGLSTANQEFKIKDARIGGKKRKDPVKVTYQAGDVQDCKDKKTYQIRPHAYSRLRNGSCGYQIELYKKRAKREGFDTLFLENLPIECPAMKLVGHVYRCSQKQAKNNI